MPSLNDVQGQAREMNSGTTRHAGSIADKIDPGPFSSIARLKRLEKGLLALSKMSGEDIVDDLDRSITAQQASAIIYRATRSMDILKASIDEEVLRGAKGDVVGDRGGARAVDG